MATSPWAVARPSSYFVSPLEVISIGFFSVPASAQARDEAQSMRKNVKNGLRIAGCEATEGGLRCKGKTALFAGVMEVESSHIRGEASKSLLTRFRSGEARLLAG